MMQDNIQFVDMCNVMMNADPEKEEKLQDRRAALWALSNIAVLSRGVAFIRVEAVRRGDGVGKGQDRFHRRDHRHCGKRLVSLLPRELSVGVVIHRGEPGAPSDDRETRLDLQYYQWERDLPAQRLLQVLQQHDLPRELDIALLQSLHR